MAVRSHADVMPVETAFSVLAVSTLGLWVLSIAVEDRRIDRQRRALRRAAVHDLTTGRARYLDSVDGVPDEPRRVRP